MLRALLAFVFAMLLLLCWLKNKVNYIADGCCGTAA
jgi:hypothetical protein